MLSRSRLALLITDTYTARWIRLDQNTKGFQGFTDLSFWSAPYLRDLLVRTANELGLCVGGGDATLPTPVPGFGLKLQIVDADDCANNEATLGRILLSTDEKGVSIFFTPIDSCAVGLLLKNVVTLFDGRIDLKILLPESY